MEHKDIIKTLTPLTNYHSVSAVACHIVRNTKIRRGKGANTTSCGPHGRAFPHLLFIHHHPMVQYNLLESTQSHLQLVSSASDHFPVALVQGLQWGEFVTNCPPNRLDEAVAPAAYPAPVVANNAEVAEMAVGYA